MASKKVNSMSASKKFALLAIVVIIVAIFLTVNLISQRQNFIQQATTSKDCPQGVMKCSADGTFYLVCINGNYKSIACEKDTLCKEKTYGSVKIASCSYTP